MMILIVMFVVSLCVSLALTPVVRALAGHCGLTDKPDGHRKLHRQPTPVAGGIAILLASLLTLSVMLATGALPWIEEFREQWSRFTGLALAAVLISGVGVLDDWGRLRGRHKLVGQVLAIAVLVASGLLVKKIHLFYWDIELGLLAVPFTVFFLLGAINSLNLLDGMDGLLGTLSLIIILAFTVLAALGGKWPTACVAATVAGAVLGFLRYNFPPATIFLGDTGSMLIGLVIGALAIQSSMKGPATVALATPLAALALPILDTTAAIFRRKLTGRSIYMTDRGHLHHCLLRRGFSVQRVLALFAVFSIVAVAGALLSVYLNSEWFALLAGLLVAGVLLGMRWFGDAEVHLALDRLKTGTASLLHLRNLEHPVQSEVRLQGSAGWSRLWATFTEAARGMNLQSAYLDINAPVLHEGYHARWLNPSLDDAEGTATPWKTSIPLVLRGQTVGRLEVTGQRDERPVWQKIEALTHFVSDVEATLAKIADDLAQPPIPPALRLPHLGGKLTSVRPASALCEPASLRVLFINRSYYPDVEATGQLLTELCSDLARQHDVEVIAGMPNFVAATHDAPLPHRDRHEGVEITRVRNFRFTKKSLFGRACGLLSYMVLAFWAGLFARRPDVIVIETDPPLLALLGAFLKRWHRCTLIFYLQDLYPEVGLAMGKLRPGLTTRLLRWSTQVGLKSADRVVVLGRDMRDRVLARGIVDDKIDIVPNWADTELIRPTPRPNTLRAEWGVDNTFVVMYSGNLGLSQNLEPLLEVADQLRGAPVSFVLIGEGAAREGLQARATALGLTNVRFLPYQPRERLAQSLGAADVHFIPLRRGLAGCIVPSKLYGILAAGVPYIAAVDADSEVARVTYETRAGMAIEPDSAAALAAALRWCLSHRAELRVMGRRARAAAEAEFSRSVAIERFGAILSHPAVTTTEEPTLDAAIVPSAVQ